MRSCDQAVLKWSELFELGRALDRAGWASHGETVERLRAFVRGDKSAPGRKTLRAAFTYANEAGEFQLVADAAKRLGIERLFEDAYLCGQVMRAREPLGLLDLDKWEAFLAAGT
jgi:hypothetical protein